MHVGELCKITSQWPNCEESWNVGPSHNKYESLDITKYSNSHKNINLNIICLYKKQIEIIKMDFCVSWKSYIILMLIFNILLCDIIRNSNA